MVINATQFNGDGSWVVEDGKALVRELERILKKNGLNDEMVPSKARSPPPKPPKKKLRIKLSLKKIQTKDASTEDASDPAILDGTDQTPSKKRGRKRKK